MLFLIATADYTGTSENHLSFTKGSRIEFIERTEGGFIKGKLNGKVGILPSSLITIETRPLSIITHNTPKDETPQKISSSPTPQPVVNNTIHTPTPIATVTPTPTPTPTVVTSTPTVVVVPPTTPAIIEHSQTNKEESVTSSPSLSSVSSGSKEDNSILSSPIVQSPQTTTTTTTSTPNINDEEDDEDSTDSEGEGNVLRKPIGENSNSSIDGADFKTLSLSDSQASFSNLRSETSESRKDRKKNKSSQASDAEGLFRKSKHGSSSKKRRYANRKYLPNITVSVFDDLPLEIRNDLQFEDISIDDIKANFKTFLRIVKFITRQRFTYVHPDEDNMTITTTTTSTDQNGIAFTTTVTTTTTTVDNNSNQVVSTKPRTQEEIKTSNFDTDPFEIDMSLDEKDKKAKHVELKLERKRILTGSSPEFLGQASTTIKVIPDIKKKIKFGDNIGKGAFGRVFEGTYEKKKVAIKVVPYSNPKQQHAVLTEIGFLSKCKHPNILSYKCSALYNSDLFIVTEFLQGGTLEQAVSSSHVFKESQIGFIGKELLKGIDYLHERKLIHRDLKSANIMITLDGEIKIIDFGLCGSIEKDTHFHMVGSPYWMAPEMVRGENISWQADIWSFGICILELLLKKPPHRESRLKAMFTNTIKGIDFSKIKCSLDLKDMLWQCFHLNPAKRSSANKLLRHPFFKRSESKSGMKGLFDNMFLQKNLNTTGFFY